MGFLPESSFGEERRALPLVPRCDDCGLAKHCETAKLPVSGNGARGILVVAEAPGADEDRQGRAGVGRNWHKLRSALARQRVDLEDDCWVTYANVCHPKSDDAPTDVQIDACRPLLFKTIRELSPKVIILLGKNAVKSVIGYTWKEEVGDIGRWTGWRIPSHEPNAWLCPTYDHKYLYATEDEPIGPVVQLWFERHLAAAVKLTERPWVTLPNYSSKVKIILDPSQAAAEIREYLRPDRPVAWDLETSSLKPGPNNFIYSCSVSDGERTISYPWVGAAIEATRDLLVSEVPKLQWHGKFEQTWIKAKLGIDVCRIVYDGMLTAHVLDNRRGVAGLKFQSYVRLGQPDYDSKIKPFLRADGGGYANNRIRSADIRDVLLYGGMDAILEYDCCMDQMKESGIHWRDLKCANR